MNIFDGIVHNNELQKQFASLCGCRSENDNGKHGFNTDDAAIVFECFLKVYGRVRAKNVALEYNSALYKGKNNVALRAGLAVVLGGGKRKAKTTKMEGSASKKKPKSDGAEESTLEETTNVVSADTDEDSKERHDALLNDLNAFDKETADDGDSQTMCIPIEGELV